MEEVRSLIHCSSVSGNQGSSTSSSTPLGAGNYQIVFEFDNALSSGIGASATATKTGGGSQPVTVSSSQIGLNNHEYLINLTGVPNAQYVTVTLTGVAGAANRGTLIGPQKGFLGGELTPHAHLAPRATSPLPQPNSTQPNPTTTPP